MEIHTYLNRNFLNPMLLNLRCSILGIQNKRRNKAIVHSTAIAMPMWKPFAPLEMKASRKTYSLPRTKVSPITAVHFRESPPMFSSLSLAKSLPDLNLMSICMFGISNHMSGFYSPQSSGVNGTVETDREQAWRCWEYGIDLDNHDVLLIYLRLEGFWLGTDVSGSPSAISPRVGSSTAATSCCVTSR